eukprot:XP_013988199.1 PREDICTED: uncharacterized protein LOC106565506 [Salmo salar]
MSLQLQISTYTEEFSSPGRGKPTRPRPTSAHRRNNPHPRPDFLLPWKLQTSHRASRSVFQGATAPVNNGRPLFPPVRHLSFQHNPDGKRACSLSAVEIEPPRMPPLSPSRTTQHMLPLADWLHKPHMTDPSIRDMQLQPLLKNIQSNMDSSKLLQQRPACYLTDVQCYRGDHPHSSQGLRRNSGIEHQNGLQNGSLPGVRHLLPQAHYRKSRSNTTLDSCGGYSCFNVVKPYQAGYYIIHPEFVSECLC